MRGRTKMLLAQEAENRRRKGNDYGNPRDNERPNNNYNNYNNGGYNNGGEMRDRPYYGYDNKPVNVYIEPPRYDGNDMRYGGESRRRDRRGRYTESSYDGYEDNQYPPPMYRESYRMGFDGGYGADMHSGSRSESNSRNTYFTGSSHNYSPDEGVTKEKAHEWTREMKNMDGTKGAHWNMEQTKGLKERLGLDVDSIEFFVAVNMMYSDYCAVAKKFGADNPEFYAHMAKAFLEDKDAGPDKLAKYFEEVVGE